MTYRSGYMDARIEGRVEERNAFATVMLQAKEPVQKIMQYTKLSLEQIKALAGSIDVAVVM